jgi:hypothetical protein
MMGAFVFGASVCNAALLFLNLHAAAFVSCPSALNLHAAAFVSCL